MMEIVKKLAEQSMKTGKPASEVVNDHVLVGLKKNELIELARVGLVFLINDYLHRLRVPSLYVKDDEDIEKPKPISLKVEKVHLPTTVSISVWTVIFDKIYYQGADGSQKPLREFTKEDCHAMNAECISKARGYSELASWFDMAARELVRHNAQMIKDLPESVKERLAKAFPRGLR